MKDTIQLLHRCDNIIKHYDHIDLLSGDRFNIFEILNLKTEEVRLHSSFIAELLNPEGSHGQGSVFLKLFTKRFNINNLDLSSTKVVKEKYIGRIEGSGKNARGGNIDIYIYDQHGISITIENKIYAGDQTDQLQRYYNHSNLNLLYLTLDGKRCDESSSHKLIEGKDYKAISYKYDILKWLEDCQKEAYRYPVIREGIYHYIALIKSLTNQTRNTHMKSEITNVLLESPANLKAALTIVNELQNVQKEVQLLFWNDLIEEITTRGFIIENKESFEGNLEQKISNLYSSRGSGFGLSVNVLKLNDKQIDWHYMIEKSISYGFVMHNNIVYDLAKLSEARKYIDIINACDNSYKSGDWWLGNKSANPSLDFKDINCPTLPKLINASERALIIKALVDKMENDINYFKSHLED